MNYIPENQENTITRFLLAEGKVKGAYLSGLSLLKAMQKAHSTGPMETMILGQAYLAAGLLSSTLKGNDRLMLQVNCSGDIKGFSVETNANGEVRGYLKNQSIDYTEIPANWDLTDYYGQGLISITRYIEGNKTPYSGQTILNKGSLAEDLAFYYLTSEQIPTAFNLSVQFSPEGKIEGAGALFLQALPGATEETLDLLTQRLHSMESPSLATKENRGAAEYLRNSFSKFNLDILTTSPVSFFCPCSKDLFEKYLKGLEVKELIDIYKNGPDPLVTNCLHCGSKFSFSHQEIKNFLDEILVEN